MTLFDENKRFLRGINAKDADAWEELYRRFYAPLCNYVWSLLGNIDEAMTYIGSRFQWDTESNSYQQFIVSLHRRFG